MHMGTCNEFSRTKINEYTKLFYEIFLSSTDGISMWEETWSISLPITVAQGGHVPKPFCRNRFSIDWPGLGLTRRRMVLTSEACISNCRYVALRYCDQQVYLIWKTSGAEIIFRKWNAFVLPSIPNLRAACEWRCDGKALRDSVKGL